MATKKMDGKKFWNSFAGKYDRIITKYASSTYAKIIENIKEELRSDFDVLEIGTGTGIISLAIADHVKSILALDNAEEMIKIAREKQLSRSVQNIDFALGDAEKLNYPKQSRDIIIASNLMHLLPRPALSLQQMHNILKDDGLIILPTYCHGANFKSRVLSFLSGLSGFKVYNRWSPLSFNKFVTTKGFTILKEEIKYDKIPMSYIVAQKTKVQK